VKTILYETDETDGSQIYNATSKILDTVHARERVGLNYTGGTKPMVRHAARALADRVKTIPHPVYSYLDARTLQMVIERSETSPMYFPVRSAVSPGLVKLLALHGYEIEEPRQTPKQFEFCNILRKIFVDANKRAAWREYLQDSQLRRLPNAQDSPLIAEARDILFEMFGAETPKPDAVQNSLGYGELKSAKEFFEGKWLEEYALQKLMDAGRALGISDYGIGMKAKKPPGAGVALELDLAAMWGYQLFALSCQATNNADRAQEHFFEIYVRAGQVGGEEARFALVCLLEPLQAKHLQEKIKTTWDIEGRVRVFGALDLEKLDEHFTNWFNTANL